MNKRKETKDLEYKVYEHYYLKHSLNCALEVSIPFGGRADFVGLKKKEVTVVEIKVSKQDFKSKNGHNFYGHKNYYAMTQELFEQVKDDIDSHIGVIVLDNFDRFKIVKNARNTKNKYPARFYEVLTKNIETAKQSNIRRLLYHRYKGVN